MERPENDKKLDGLLHSWKLEVEVSPRFQEQVWQRIEHEERPAPAGLAWLTRLFMRPALAAAAAMILLLAGLGVGFMQANRDSARWNDQLAHRYAASVNPYTSGQQ